jgi:glycosyltransferase involved in cell wall biosynthesis
MMRSLITILMPLKHYHPRYLQKALHSVFRQSDPDWRLSIIVDRRDRTHFQNLLSQDLLDDRVRLNLNEGKGLAGALNSGMRAASTEFSAILLADDQWSHNAIAILNDHIRTFQNIDFFHSSRRYINENDEPISSVYPSRSNFRVEDFLLSSPVKHLLCWRVSKALEIGGMDESLSSHGVDDYDFPWSMAERGAIFRSVPDCLYLYRDHRDCIRLTTHVPLTITKRILRKMMKKHHAPDAAISAKIADAEKTYLRQCLFKSLQEKRLKEASGFEANLGYRREYL